MGHQRRKKATYWIVLLLIAVVGNQTSFASRFLSSRIFNIACLYSHAFISQYSKPKFTCLGRSHSRYICLRCSSSCGTCFKFTKVKAPRLVGSLFRALFLTQAGYRGQMGKEFRLPMNLRQGDHDRSATAESLFVWSRPFERQPDSPPTAGLSDYQKFWVSPRVPTEMRSYVSTKLYSHSTRTEQRPGRSTYVGCFGRT